MQLAEGAPRAETSRGLPETARNVSSQTSVQLAVGSWCQQELLIILLRLLSHSSGEKTRREESSITHVL